MANDNELDAWNNFVMHVNPDTFEIGSLKRYAQIASLYWGLSMNGGINSFLTCSYELDTPEVLESLKKIDALVAAKQFEDILDILGGHFAVASQDQRSNELSARWTEEKDDIIVDCISHESNLDLENALEKHVNQNLEFYLKLK